MFGIHDTQYLCLCSIQDTRFFGLVAMMHNICNWYPCYTIFMSGVHDTQYLCLVSMIHNISVRISSVILCIVDPIPSKLSLSN